MCPKEGIEEEYGKYILKRDWANGNFPVFNVSLWVMIDSDLCNNESGLNQWVVVN